jgi:predicted patatin/cPLA2 family phospholipase
VSAGACDFSSHLADQYKRNYHCYTGPMIQPRFISFAKFLRGGHLMDLDWVWDKFDRDLPLNADRLIGNLSAKQKEFIIVCTDVGSGRPLYLTPNRNNMSLYLKASCSVPLLYRRFLRIDNLPVTDGGASDPIPVEEAYRRGARKIYVIRSRPADFIKEYNFEARFLAFMFRKYPGLQGAIKNLSGIYRKSVHFINNPPSDAEMIHVAPPQLLKTGRTTQDIQCLESDYQMGLQVGREYINLID